MTISQAVAIIAGVLLLGAVTVTWIAFGWLAAAVRFAITIVPSLSHDYRHRRIKPRQVCPACGDRGPHDLKFEPKEPTEGPQPGLVVLTCRKCSARWGYNPIVKTQLWVKPPTEE